MERQVSRVLLVAAEALDPTLYSNAEPLIEHADMYHNWRQCGNRTGHSYSCCKARGPGCPGLPLLGAGQQSREGEIHHD